LRQARQPLRGSNASLNIRSGCQRRHGRGKRGNETGHPRRDVTVRIALEWKAQQIGNGKHR
jgi:hypothetical protein